VREETCRGLEHLGIRIDRERNVRHEMIISVAGGACTVRTLRTDEDLMIARHTRAVVAM
jgi:acetate kinase